MLREREVPTVVAGAFALHEHTGIWRDTKDLDFFLAPDDVQDALRHLASVGCRGEVCDPVWLAKAHRDGFFVDLITGMSNGVVNVDESWIARGRPASVLGVETLVAAPEELFASKLFVARRERFDGVDLAHLVHAVGRRLEWPRVLALVDDHWGMLLWSLTLFQYAYPAEADVVPQVLWRELLGRFQRAIEQPDPAAPFRGSLVDERMFAIDVNEWGLPNLLESYRAGRLIPPAPPRAPRPASRRGRR